MLSLVLRNLPKSGAEITEMLAWYRKTPPRALIVVLLASAEQRHATSICPFRPYLANEYSQQPRCFRFIRRHLPLAVYRHVAQRGDLSLFDFPSPKGGFS